MAITVVVATFDALDQAKGALRQLETAGFDAARVSIVANDLQETRTVQGYVRNGTEARRAAAAAAGWGAMTGGLCGLLLDTTFLALPLAGLLGIPGPLATGLAGAVSGAVGGAFVGALVGAGIPHHVRVTFQEAVPAGRYLVVVQGSSTETSEAAIILRRSADVV